MWTSRAAGRTTTLRGSFLLSRVGTGGPGLSKERQRTDLGFPLGRHEEEWNRTGQEFLRQNLRTSDPSP